MNRLLILAAAATLGLSACSDLGTRYTNAPPAGAQVSPQATSNGTTSLSPAQSQETISLFPPSDSGG
jgi:hypothetical protein